MYLIGEKTVIMVSLLVLITTAADDHLIFIVRESKQFT